MMDMKEKLYYFAEMLDKFHQGRILSKESIINLLKQFHDFYQETTFKTHPELLDLIKDYEQQLQSSS